MRPLANILFSTVVLPKIRISNLTLYKDNEKALKFFKNTGILYRRYTEEGFSTSDLASESLRPIKSLGLVPSACLVGTSSPDCPSPATAHYVHYNLKLSQDVFACDISSSCTSALSAVLCACGYLGAASTGQTVWVCSSEVKHSFLNPNDSRLYGLFGDEAAGLCLEPSKGNHAFEGLYLSSVAVHSHLVHNISIPGGGSRLPFKSCNPEDIYLSMREPRFMYSETVKIFVSLVNKVWKHRTELCLKLGLNPEITAGLLFIHQANGSILNDIRKRVCSQIKHRIPTFISASGNTLGASMLSARCKYLIVYNYYKIFKNSSLPDKISFKHFLLSKLKKIEQIKNGSEYIYIKDMNEDEGSWVLDMSEDEFLILIDVLENDYQLQSSVSTDIAVDIWISGGGGFQALGFLHVRRL